MKRHRAIEDRALDWLVRREGADWTEREDAALDAWLGESLAHKAAFWRAQHGWRQADRVASLGFDANQKKRHPAPTSEPGRWRSLAIAASLLAAISIGGLGTLVLPYGSGGQEAEQSQFHTPAGIRKTVELADGSTVELNTRTKVRAAVGREHREVWLDSGEAFFDVAPTEGKPFVVHAGHKTITVLGTKFSVRRDGEGVAVNVLEGRVRVADVTGRNAQAATISQGGTVVARGGSTLITPPSVERVDRALAWRTGLIRFDQAPLSEVVAEFNRYHRIQLVVTDRAAADILIGGSFEAAGVHSFTRLLHDAYGLKVVRDGDLVRISSR